MSEDIPVVHKTTDYAMFKNFTANRPVTDNRELKHVISIRNKLKYNPITVDKNLTVINGQHRLRIAKELQVPIYYMIDPEGTIEDVQKVNIGTRNWDTHNHVDYFAHQGVQEYEFLQKLKQISGLTLTLAISTFVKNQKQSKLSGYRSGKIEFKFSDKECLDLAKKLGRIIEFVKQTKGSRSIRVYFYYGLIRFCTQYDFDPEEFCKKIANSFDHYDNALKTADISKVHYFLTQINESQPSTPQKKSKVKKAVDQSKFAFAS